MAGLKKASDYNNKTLSIDDFIIKEVQPLLDKNHGSANLYLNVIHQEGVSIKVLKDRLKELGYKTFNGKEGVDDVLFINA